MTDSNVLALELKPVDTVFFRGTLPLEAGRNCTSIFPPSSETLTGALRTLLLQQNGISIESFKKGDIPEKIASFVGTYGNHNQGFKVCGFMLKRNDELYYSAPADVFITEKTNGSACSKIAFPLDNDFASLGIISSSGKLPFRPSEMPEESKGVNGKWVNYAEGNGSKYLPSSEFYSIEFRTGIGIDSKSMTTGDGRIYAAGHIRLHDCVSMVVLVDKNIPIEDCGWIKLGGEGRLTSYKKTWIRQYQTTGTRFISLLPVEATDENKKHLIASYKLVRFGGWDYAKRFYKPLKQYFPAGAVFDYDVENVCLVQ